MKRDKKFWDKESVTEKIARADVVARRLKKAYPRAKIALKFGNDMQMLVAVILSAQCTDKKVNEVTVLLFKKYKNAKDFAGADLKTFEKEIRQTGFYHAKAKNIIASAKIINKQFGGKLPKTMEEMLTLAGVARKTANIALYQAYGVISGIAVDTHVKRVSHRLGLTKNIDPNKIEKDLMALLPRREWGDFNLRMVDHGRAICAAKKPLCAKCVLNDICPSAFTFE